MEATTALQKADVVSRGLSRFFCTMDLLGMSYGELEGLFASDRSNLGEETREEAQA